MSIALHWYLPTHGDGRTLLQAGAATQSFGVYQRGDSGGTGRAATLDYLAQVARAAEQSGFDAALTPTGTWCDDAWITTAALMSVVDRLRFLVAFRPGSIAPTLAAQQAMTFQRHSGGRLLLNIVTGGDDEEQRRYGEALGEDDRYARTDEFLTILRGAWSGEPFTFDGDHLWVLGRPAANARAPPPTRTRAGGGRRARAALRHPPAHDRA
jgi:alkanesulfonate monooxygenase